MRGMHRAPRYTVVLAKQEFKFSAAHFTLFADGAAETLHGHNYRVEVELAGDRLDEHGLLIDFQRVKRMLRQACARLDDRILVPDRSPELDCRADGDSVEVRYRDRRYRFPADEVLLLPLVNSSIELLARLIWEELAGQLEDSLVELLTVTVEETDGQLCRFVAPLARGTGAEGL
jgi:6-pyruvoyltetrahydropterin/6-carboxytetrahydropterin synthase